jgi:hypothetical protein
MEGQHRGAIGVLEIISQREGLGPVGAVAVADLDHPSAVGLVAAVQQKDAARQRRPAVGPAADGELVQSRAAAFHCAKADLACHENVSPFPRSVAIVSVKAYEGV